MGHGMLVRLRLLGPWPVQPTLACSTCLSNQIAHWNIVSSRRMSSEGTEGTPIAPWKALGLSQAFNLIDALSEIGVKAPTPVQVCPCVHVACSLMKLCLEVDFLVFLLSRGFPLHHFT